MILATNYEPNTFVTLFGIFVFGVCVTAVVASGLARTEEAAKRHRKAAEAQRRAAASGNGNQAEPGP